MKGQSKNKRAHFKAKNCRCRGSGQKGAGKNGAALKEQNSYRMVHIGKTSKIFNAANLKHKQLTALRALNSTLKLNDKKKFTGNRPLNACTATSGQNKIVCRKKCRQAAGVQTQLKPNISLWVAFIENPIMGTTLQEIFLAFNCPALSYTGLQCSGSNNGPMMVEMVEEGKFSATHTMDAPIGCEHFTTDSAAFRKRKQN
uniref:Uncharacterized protein n=1 Tax=Magallana gigas TaxID=29159 RepID=K1RHW8_MAGGI